MIDPSEGKEIKKDYLETLEALLKNIFQKAKEKEYKPDKQILIKIGQENVYKGGKRSGGSRAMVRNCNQNLVV